MNPSFDSVDSRYCDHQIVSFSQGVCNPWRKALDYDVPNYKNACSPFMVSGSDTLYEVPWNTSGGYGYQQARTGGGVTAIATTQRVGDEINIYSNYARGKVSQTLIAGKKYYCGFYINFCNFSAFICNNFGMYLSSDTLAQYYYMYPWDTLGNPAKRLIPEVPQINNPPGNSLYDTLNWILIADTIVAQGGEKYLFLGQFDDGNPIDSGRTGFTGTTYLGNNVPPYEKSSFVLDDIFVIMVDTITGIKQEEVTAYYKQTQNEIVITLPTPYALQSIKLFNSNGQQVYDKEYNPPSGKSRVPLPNLPNGIYVTELITVNGYKLHKKVVINNME